MRVTTEKQTRLVTKLVCCSDVRAGIQANGDYIYQCVLCGTPYVSSTPLPRVKILESTTLSTFEFEKPK